MSAFGHFLWSCFSFLLKVGNTKISVVFILLLLSSASPAVRIPLRKKKQSTEIIKFSTTISVAHWQKKTPSLKFYLGIHFFLVFFLCFSFFLPPVCRLSHLSSPFRSPFMLFSPLLSLHSYRAFGCLSTSDRASGSTFWQAVHSKTQGYGHHPTLALTHTHTISLCVHAHSGSTQHVQKCDTLKQTHINLNTHNPCFRSPCHRTRLLTSEGK